MRIIDLSPGWSRSLYVRDIMSRDDGDDYYKHPGIEFNERGIANVKKEVGEALVADDRFQIERYDPDADYDWETIAPHLEEAEA